MNSLLRLHLFWFLCLAAWTCLSDEPVRPSRGRTAPRTAEDRYARDLLGAFEGFYMAGKAGSPAVGPKPGAELLAARAALAQQPADLSAALRLIETAAAKGEAAAQYLMGYVKENELPFEGQVEIRGDFVEAAEWYEKAAVQGAVPAMLVLGGFHAFGKLGQHDIATAARWWEQAAKADSVEAMRQLGWLYQHYTPETNTRLAPQYEKAFEWFQRAANKGDSEAMYQMARHYHFAKGTPRNEAQSQYWLAKAASAGHPAAALVRNGTVEWEAGYFAVEGGRLLELAPSEKPPARRFANAEKVTEDDLIMAMNAGSQEARLVLGEKYEFGLGVKQNLATALRHYSQVMGPTEGYRSRWISVQASEATLRIFAGGKLGGDAPATLGGIKEPEQLPLPASRFQLAELYWRGNAAVKANPTQAVAWYLHAARAGSAPAMRRLGELWRDGVNGSPDPAEAQRWFRLAAAKEKEQGATAPR